MQTSTANILVAIITAVATIAASLIGAGIIVRAEVAELSVEVSRRFERREPNVQYQEQDGGFVLVVVRASSDNRSVLAEGVVGDESIVSTMAQDSYVIGVPSISTTSFTMPVPDNTRWLVRVNPKDADLLSVRWFSSTSRLGRR